MDSTLPQVIVKWLSIGFMSIPVLFVPLGIYAICWLLINWAKMFIDWFDRNITPGIIKLIKLIKKNKDMGTNTAS